jgi:hypothetical protein
MSRSCKTPQLPSSPCSQQQEIPSLQRRWMCSYKAAFQMGSLGAILPLSLSLLSLHLPYILPFFLFTKTPPATAVFCSCVCVCVFGERMHVLPKPPCVCVCEGAPHPHHPLFRKRSRSLPINPLSSTAQILGNIVAGVLFATTPLSMSTFPSIAVARSITLCTSILVAATGHSNMIMYPNPNHKSASPIAHPNY